MPSNVQPAGRPRYRTWVRDRLIAVFGGLTALCLAVAAFGFVSAWALLALIPAVAVGWIFFVLMMARYRFSERGGRYQARIHQLIVERAHGAHMLDVGCGNGHLAIQLAKAGPGRHVTGIDYWGSAWEYSQQACEENARLEGVADRTQFVQGSASALPFADGEFDCVVSCMTFHEVRDVEDKTASLAEALRVLQPGGRFVAIDLFSDPGYYPKQERIAERLEAAGVDFTANSLSELLPLPFPLNGKRLLRYARLITGTKASLE